MTTVLTLVGFLCLLAACHPFLTYPWSLVVLQALRPARPAGAARPADRLNCAVCVCAYNEEHVIARKVENLLALRAREPDLEILIYVDGAERPHRGNLAGVRICKSTCISAERHGKTYGMNLLAAKAQAPILIFTDANVIDGFGLRARFPTLLRRSRDRLRLRQSGLHQ